MFILVVKILFNFGNLFALIFLGKKYAFWFDSKKNLTLYLGQRLLRYLVGTPSVSARKKELRSKDLFRLKNLGHFV